MPYKRLSDETRAYEALSNLQSLSFWWVSGSEWSSIIRNECIREECVAVTNQPLETRKSGSTRGIVLLGVLTVLSLLGAATLLIQEAPVASRTSQENVKTVSVK